jgi:CubicO group peptidase (beta-lactamase class C family)
MDRASRLLSAAIGLGLALGAPAAHASAAPKGFDEPAFRAFLSYVFPEPRAPGRAGIRTDGLVILHRGALVFEKYHPPYGPGDRHHLWSVAKSVTSALIGAAEREGLIRRETLVADASPALDRSRHPGLRVEHLLRMSSGIEWRESYETSFLMSSVLAMLYSAGPPDLAAYVYSQPRQFEPGSRWRYSSGETNLLASLLKARLPADEYAEYPWRRLFEPLGMGSAVLETDGSGTWVGSSFLHMRPRELASLGQLLLQKGLWKGRRLLDEEWVAWSLTLVPAYLTTDVPAEDARSSPGAHWWVNAPDPRRKGSPLPWPDAPADAFAALGHWGQSMFVIPSRQLVVVRVADDRERSFDRNAYLKLLLRSLPR